MEGLLFGEELPPSGSTHSTFDLPFKAKLISLLSSHSVIGSLHFHMMGEACIVARSGGSKNPPLPQRLAYLRPLVPGGRMGHIPS